MSAEVPWAALISVDKVMELRDVGIKRYGGMKHRGDPEDCVDGALGAAWHAAVFRSEEEDADKRLQFAGFLLFYLATKQCFSEGNKRAAWASAMWVLASKQLTVRATVDEAVGLMNEAIAKKVDGDRCVIWLSERIDVA